MGGQKRGRTQRRHFKSNKDNVWKRTRPDPSTDNNGHWEPFATQNPAFEEYYKEQGIVPEEEWDEFIRVLRKPLPAAFRINSSCQFFMDIRSQLEKDFVKTLEAEVTNEDEVEAIRPLPWYPDNLAWHLNFSRMQLRKNQTLERFHEFLKQENEIGNITRQEAVSMVPPLFLDVHPDHFVLDMCAAPGSKTFQLLEIIHQSAQSGSLPDGLVIANDVDVQRCNLLIHQTKRMCSANLIVTNHEAQHFPGCRLVSKLVDTSKKGSLNDVLGDPQQNIVPPQEQSKRFLLFDRVLCDVPCSGDGTLRKAPDIWRKWNAGMGNGVHRLQVQIAMRGLSLLKVGGRMVYSTCSMNPVENEAVVAEVLRRSGDSVQLLDVSAELPQLVRRPGLKKWKVRDKGAWLVSYRDIPSHRKCAIVPSMFPSGETCEGAESDCAQEDLGARSNNLVVGLHNGIPEYQEHGLGLEDNATSTDSCEDQTRFEEVSTFPLERCMRIVAHDQNSGAFFIAVMHKLAPLPDIPEKTTTHNRRSSQKKHEEPEKLPDAATVDTMSEVAPDEIPEAASNVADKPTSTVPIEEAIVEVSLEHSEGTEQDELDESGNGGSGLVVSKTEKGKLQIQGKWRGVDPVVFFRDDATIKSIRTFYGITESFSFDGHLVTRNSDVNHVKRIYYVSKSVTDVLELNFQVGQQLKITSLGLKIFERQTSKEGLPGSSACAFRISSEGLPLLLPYISKQILSTSIADFEHLLKYRTIKFADFVDPAFGEKVTNLMLGCCVMVLNQDGPTSDAIVVDTSTIAIGCWKGRTNVTVMVSERDCQELLERLSIRLGKGKNDGLQKERDNLELNEVAETMGNAEIMEEVTQDAED